MAAARTEGETVIKMASATTWFKICVSTWQKLGVKISGIGSSTLRVQGVKILRRTLATRPSEDPVER